MKVYELTNNGYETENVPQIIFDDLNMFSYQINANELKLSYDVSEEFMFPVLDSWISVLIQDIHNDILCGILSVNVPLGEDCDTITYIIRFDEIEFEKIKKIYLTKFLMWIIMK